MVPLGTAPDGLNINDGCGSNHPEHSARGGAASTGPHLGIALDGDADRLVLVDERGGIVDGDQVLALIAAQLAGRGRLRGGAWWPP